MCIRDRCGREHHPDHRGIVGRRETHSAARVFCGAWGHPMWFLLAGLRDECYGAAEGSTIRTIEGLSEDGKLTPLQESFVEHGAIQCGFCSPGFVMSATELLK